MSTKYNINKVQNLKGYRKSTDEEHVLVSKAMYYELASKYRAISLYLVLLAIAIIAVIIAYLLNTCSNTLSTAEVILQCIISIFIISVGSLGLYICVSDFNDLKEAPNRKYEIIEAEIVEIIKHIDAPNTVILRTMIHNEYTVLSYPSAQIFHEKSIIDVGIKVFIVKLTRRNKCNYFIALPTSEEV